MLYQRKETDTIHSALKEFENAIRNKEWVLVRSKVCFILTSSISIIYNQFLVQPFGKIRCDKNLKKR